MTLFRWVQRFTPLLIDAARPCHHIVGDRWFVDGTYVKVAGVWWYVYRSVDHDGQIPAPSRRAVGNDRPGLQCTSASVRLCIAVEDLREAEMVLALVSIGNHGTRPSGLGEWAPIEEWEGQPAGDPRSSGSTTRPTSRCAPS